MTCHFCGREIVDASGAFQRVIGWERPGRGLNGVSGSSLVLREKAHELAHPDCIAKAQHGLNAAQESLV